MKVRRILILFLIVFTFNNAFSQVGLEEQSAYLDSVLVVLESPEKIDNPSVILSIIDEQLNLKNSLTSKLKNQIIQLDKDVYNNELFYQRLNSQLDYEKNIYASLIVTASRLRTLMYQNFDIFSFDNLYKTYRQFLYIKWLTDYRQKKIMRIKALKAEIATVVSTLDSIKAAKNVVAEKLGVEQTFIKRYSSSRNLIAQSYTENKEEEVSREIIKNNIDSLRTPDLTAGENETTLFQVQKGYLMWPVRKAVIIRYFGESKHPVYDKVTVKNDGLDFCVPQSSKVQCVYNGIVAKVVKLPQNKFSVIVRHGSYYTVYSGLDHINVSQGDMINKGDITGGFDAENGDCVLNFQIWLGTEVLNPYHWLVKNTKNNKK